MLATSLAVGGIFAVLAWRRARDVAFIAPVVVAFAAVTLVAQTFMGLTADWSRNAGVGATTDWIEQATNGEPVSVLWYEPGGRPWVGPAARHRIVWLNEFFNRNVGEVYELGSSMPYAGDLDGTPVRLDDGRVERIDGVSARLGPFVLAPCWVHVDGEPVSRDATTGAVVYRVAGSAVRASVTEPADCLAS
jgi:hypothetical protein